MARHKNVPWKLPENNGVERTHEWESIHAALLMDIRDELQELNRTLNCTSTRSIPKSLRKIVENTTKPQRKAKP